MDPTTNVAIQILTERIIANIHHTVLTEMGELVRDLMMRGITILYRDMPDGAVVKIYVADEYEKYIFFTDLNQASTIQDIIFILATTRYDLSQEDQPDFIISIIEKHIHSVEDAALIAQVFKKRLGDIVICRDASTQIGHLATLLDCICTYVEMFSDGDRYFYFRLAFTNAGFKRSKDCSTQLLRALFFLDPEYYHLTTKVNYDYEEISKESKVQAYELMPFLCRPSFVERWIEENGMDVEDYLA